MGKAGTGTVYVPYGLWVLEKAAFGYARKLLKVHVLKLLRYL